MQKNRREAYVQDQWCSTSLGLSLSLVLPCAFAAAHHINITPHHISPLVGRRTLKRANTLIQLVMCTFLHYNSFTRMPTSKEILCPTQLLVRDFNVVRSTRKSRFLIPFVLNCSSEAKRATRKGILYSSNLVTPFARCTRKFLEGNRSLLPVRNERKNIFRQ